MSKRKLNDTKQGIIYNAETKILKEDVSLEPHTAKCSFTFQEAEIWDTQKQIKASPSNRRCQYFALNPGEQWSSTKRDLREPSVEVQLGG